MIIFQKTNLTPNIRLINYRKDNIFLLKQVKQKIKIFSNYFSTVKPKILNSIKGSYEPFMLFKL